MARDREGACYPAILPKHLRCTGDLGDIMVYLTSSRVSKKKIAQVINLMLGRRCSHETILKPTDQVVASAEAFRDRPLRNELAYLYLNRLSLKVFEEAAGVIRQTV
jgi:putative transposase